MERTKITETKWHPEERLVISQLSGELEIADIEKWEDSLKTTLDRIEGNTTFRIFLNMYGFAAVDIAAHKRFRSVVPTILADYGWKVGYVDLFEEEAKAMKYSRTRGIRCIAAAHSHHDGTKMDLYEAKCSSPSERFFVDPLEARKWIENRGTTDEAERS